MRPAPRRRDDPLGPWCERTGVLSDWAWANGGDFSASVPPHLHVVIPVGVQIPGVIAGSIEAPGGGGSHALVVGRFTPVAGACSGPRRDCDERFTVDRFAWVDGVRVGLTPLVAHRLDTGTKRANPFTLALDAADMPLLGVLTWPDGVAALDPDAAAAAADGPPSVPVWYLRILDGAREPGAERRVRWVLLAERDLRVIAAGRPHGAEPVAASGQPGASTGTGPG